MAILLDLNQVMLATLLVSLGQHTNIKIEESLLRHMILNSIRANRMKFKHTFGELIICCDSSKSWRKSYFPQYKANRKKAREQIDLDWPEVFRVLNKIQNELKDNFPYPVICVDGAEADDIIAHLAHPWVDETTLILSGDKDFIQLHSNPNIKQYNPVKKKYIKHTDSPKDFLKSHIIKGDFGDGVPNVLSDDDCFVLGKRQKSITEDKFKMLSTCDESKLDINIQRNFKRNRTLIDLNNVPIEIKENINKEYISQSNKNRSKLLEYFMKNKLKNLMESITDF